jgi:4-hydroxy-tetrahydrodipicolinate synthase
MIVAPKGLGVALATPFHADGSLDTGALAKLVAHVVEGGADFLVALGSTGEAAMLDEAERDQVITTVRERAPRTPLLVGTGASSTAQAIAWTRRARQLGAQGALVVVPPYVKPSPAGMIAHFEAVADAAPELAIVLYNVPSRAGVNMPPATVQSLWQLPNVVAIKESAGDLQQVGRLCAELPPGKVVLAGDDALAVPTIALGGQGLVSVAGNAVPAAMRDLITAARSGNSQVARKLHNKLLPLFDAMFVEPNPVPVKAALSVLGIAEPTVRLPLLPASAATRERLAAALRTAQVEAMQG